MKRIPFILAVTIAWTLTPFIPMHAVGRENTQLAEVLLEKSRMRLADGDLQGALAAYEKAQILSPRHTAQYPHPMDLEGARQWIKRGDQAKAPKDKATNYERALEVDSKNYPVMAKLAKAYFDDQRLRDSWNLLEHLDREAPSLNTRSLRKRLEKALLDNGGDDATVVKKRHLDQRAGAIRAGHPDVTYVSVHDYLTLVQSRLVILVDVRTAGEQLVSRLPMALSLDQFEENSGAYRDWTLIFYCHNGSRSGAVARNWADQHFETACLEGGILAWTHAGFELVAEEQVSRKVHVFQKTWDLAASGYETVW